MTDATTDHSDRRMTPLVGTLWTIALWLLEHVCVGVTAGARPGAMADIVSLTACVVLATSIVVFVIVRLRAPDESLRAVFGVRRLPLSGLLFAVAAGAGLCPALSALDDIVISRWPYDDAEALENVHNLVSQSSRVALVVGIFVVIPIVREVFFRGILFSELSRGARSSFVPIVVTSLLFASFSLDWRTLPSAMILGLALGWLRAGSGTIFAALLAHLAFWAVEGLPILRGGDPTADVTYPGKWVAAGALLAVLALLGSGALARRRRSS